MVVVQVNVSSYLLVNMLHSFSGFPVSTNTFILDSTVESFNMSVVVRAMRSSVADDASATSDPIFKPRSKLWTIIRLYSLKLKAKQFLSFSNSFCCLTLAKFTAT